MSNALTRWVADLLKRKLVYGVAYRRDPDFVIGPRDDPYLRRWWVIPRNALFNVYLHEFLHDDDDRALHDHPFWSVSLTLDGEMDEIFRRRQRDVRRSVSTGDVIFRSGSFAHRMLVNRPSWTLFITGPRYREWGFLCPKGWIRWQDFVAADDKGNIGRGCGE